jgi:hypothetical protein
MIKKFLLFTIAALLINTDLCSQISAGGIGSDIITGYSDSSFSYNYGTSGEFTGSCPLDMDNDSIFDFNFYAYNYTSGYPERALNVYTSHQVMVNASGYPEALMSGEVIDSSKTWASGGILQKVITFSAGTGTFGEWCPNDAYLGIRLNYPGDTLYGYIYVHAPMTPAGYSVMNYGYEKPKTNVGLGPERNFSEAVLFPNPFSGELNIRFSSVEIIRLIMYDVFSKKVIDKCFSSPGSIDTEGMSEGLYIYELRLNEQVVSRGKLIKQ